MKHCVLPESYKAAGCLDVSRRMEAVDSRHPKGRRATSQGGVGYIYKWGEWAGPWEEIGDDVDLFNA